MGKIYDFGENCDNAHVSVKIERIHEFYETVNQLSNYVIEMPLPMEDKVAECSRVGADITKEIVDVHRIGKINREIFKCIMKGIITDEVVITDKQIRHIIERHPEIYGKITHLFPEALDNPDFVIEDGHINTGLVVKKIKENEKHIQIVLRVCTSNDPKGYKNSVISCWIISEKRLQNYLKNKKVLYRRE